MMASLHGSELRVRARAGAPETRAGKRWAWPTLRAAGIAAIFSLVAACVEKRTSPATNLTTTETGSQQTPPPAAATTATAPTMLESSAAIEAILAPIREKNNLPALIGAIVDDEKLLEIGVVGDRKFDTGVKATVNDLWHLGSCTKAMTATLIARLVEQGKLKWTTTVGEAFPELREKMLPEWRDVPIEWLVQNRGGAPHELKEDGLWAQLWSATGTPEQARMMLVEGVVARAPEAPPGTKNIYSNAGFSMAGAMAEHITGRAWEDLMRDELFAPLGMVSAGFGAPGAQGSMEQPWGHTLKGKKLRAINPGPMADNPAAISPAGRVHCTFADWGKFVSAHLRGVRAARGLISADELQKKPALPVSPEMFATLHTPPKGQAYAMGWGEMKRSWGGQVFTHNGSNTMWFCVTWASPEKNFAVLVGTNAAGDGVDKAVDSAAAALIQHHFKSGAK